MLLIIVYVGNVTYESCDIFVVSLENIELPFNEGSYMRKKYVRGDIP